MEFRFDRLDSLASEAGFRSDSALAAAAGIDRAVLTRLRKGQQKSVASSTAQRLAEVVGTSPDYLWGLTDEAGLKTDRISPDLALLVEDIATLSAHRRADLIDFIQILRRADRIEGEFRETLMRVVEAFLSRQDSVSLAAAFDLLRSGDTVAATALVDRIISERNAEQPVSKTNK